MKFKVFYADGSVYSGAVETTPTDNVLVIVERSREHGRRLVSNGDYYCWDAKRERWFPGDFMHFVQYLREDGMKRVLFGRTVENDEWNDVMRRATNDPDFPAKTGYDFHERKADR